MTRMHASLEKDVGHRSLGALQALFAQQHRTVQQSVLASLLRRYVSSVLAVVNSRALVMYQSMTFKCNSKQQQLTTPAQQHNYNYCLALMPLSYHLMPLAVLAHDNAAKMELRASTTDAQSAHQLV
eukprot:21323-Heterococcus_DN1.PRE.1